MTRAFVMGTFQLGIPYVLFIWGLKTVPTTDAALITLIEPVLNPIWVWLLIGEMPHGSTIVGKVLSAGGYVLIVETDTLRGKVLVHKHAIDMVEETA